MACIAVVAEGRAVTERNRMAEFNVFIVNVWYRQEWNVVFACYGTRSLPRVTSK